MGAAGKAGACVGKGGDSDRITTERQKKKKKKYKVKGGRVENGWRQEMQLRERVTMHGWGTLFVPRVAWLSAPVMKLNDGRARQERPGNGCSLLAARKKRVCR